MKSPVGWQSVFSIYSASVILYSVETAPAVYIAVGDVMWHTHCTRAVQLRGTCTRWIECITLVEKERGLTVLWIKLEDNYS